MSSDLFQALANNTEVDGYHIDKVIGSGGFGITYLGHDLGLDKSVAIKEYLPRDLAVRVDNQSVRAASSSDKDDFTWGLQRFLDEARMLARFDHKNIVRVHRFFQAHGTAYIVMEYVDGETLSSLLQREQTLSYQHLLSILNPLLSGLEIVHKSDILHRDIKPGNIIIRDSGAPVLIDFGAARQAVGARSRSVTAIVTPGYAPIEQYSTRGRQGPWTDIYALGAICYRAMTGETPIDATERVRRDPLVPLSKQPIPEGYPGSFLSAVDRALSVDEEERPQSIGEWRDMFEGRVEAGAISAPIADERAKTRPLPRDSRPAASTGQSQTPSGFKPSKGFVFGGIGAVAVTGLVITLLSFGGRGPTPEPDPPNIAEQTIITPELAAAWTRAQTLNTAEAYEGFLGTWADSPYADDAKAAIAEAARQEAERQKQARCRAWNSGDFFKTASAGDVRACLRAGADPEARIDSDFDPGLTPLHQAARHGHAYAIAALIEAGADPEARTDRYGSTPLHQAAYRGHAGAIAALIEAGADPEARNEFDNTPLKRAMFAGNVDAIAALIEAGADPEARDKDGATPLHMAAGLGRAGTIPALIEAGADTEARDDNDLTPLHKAAYWGRADAIAALIEAGADTEARDEDGNTPLHQAAYWGRAGTILALIEAGADTEARDEDGNTPLHLVATRYGVGDDITALIEDAIAALLEAGADPKARNNIDQTPFDMIRSDSPLIGTQAYRRLQQAR